MKKILTTLFISIFLPINILAYSLNIIPGGESIGIKINTRISHLMMEKKQLFRIFNKNGNIR